MAKKPGPGVLGEAARVLPLEPYKANSWNPNKMTDPEMAALRHGMAQHGWPASEALLVWGKDNKGKARNLIINGEHRHTAARDIGMTHGPVVVLDGLTEAEAKAWTVRLDKTRGRFMDALLAPLVVELGLPAIDLGFEEEELTKLIDLSEATGGKHERSSSGGVKLVQLRFNEREHRAWLKGLSKAGELFGTETASESALAALKAATK